MKIKKLSLDSVKNVLSRAELKKIMAGSGGGCGALGQACYYNAPSCCPGLYCNFGPLSGSCEV